MTPLEPDGPKAVCPKCHGAGKLTYRIAGSEEKVDLGNGTYMQDCGGSGSRQCDCTRDLPAIDGEAKWWSLETIYSEIVSVPIGNESCEISADCEIPIGDGGRRVHRTADNAYYPPLIKVLGLADATLHAETAREIAAKLIAAADACDKADELAMQTANGGYGG